MTWLAVWALCVVEAAAESDLESLLQTVQTTEQRIAVLEARRAELKVRAPQPRPFGQF